LAGKTTHAATYAFLDPLGLALTCVTRDLLSHTGTHAQEQPHAATLAHGQPVALKREPRLFLSVMLQYRLVEDDGPRGPWKVRTTAYSYTVEDGDGAEIIAYHWHPHARGSDHRPHLHFRSAGKVGEPGWAHIHFPSGRVALEDVLRLLIREMGVEPLREDWEEILDETQAGFEKWRTWGGQAVPETP
jgi:hypothetical protein